MKNQRIGLKNAFALPHRKSRWPCALTPDQVTLVTTGTVLHRLRPRFETRVENSGLPSDITRTVPLPGCEAGGKNLPMGKLGREA